MMKDLFGHVVPDRMPAPPRKGGRPSRAYLVALRLSRGQHPHQGVALGPEGETCGSCAHCERFKNYGGNKRWAKCALTPGGHVATDIKVRWPSCAKWKAREVSP